MPFDLAAYGPAVADLLREPRLPDLGPGRPIESAQPALARLTPELLCGGPPRRPKYARACLSGLWLLFDFLDESHRLSQELSDEAGAFWHGIMHRREGDFGNAKYWFRRVGPHPIFPKLAKAAGQAKWDPFAFVDRCEACATSATANAEQTRAVQWEEWGLLFDYCFRQATGSL